MEESLCCHKIVLHTQRSVALTLASVAQWTQSASRATATTAVLTVCQFVPFCCVIERKKWFN
jgi:hypothetical protein